LIFTVEKQDAENGFQLNYHSRYAHTPRYVTECLTAADFELHALETVVLRQETSVY
jgi:predicted TPR repeat methyltransferase